MPEDLRKQNTTLRRLVTDYHRRMVLLSKALEGALASLKHIRKHHPVKYEKGDDEIFGAEILKLHGAK